MNLKANPKSQIPNSKKILWNLGFGIWNFLTVVLATTIPCAAHAQSSNGNGFDFGINSISQILILPEGDPRLIAVRLINVALEFLAILMLVMVVWGGFQFLLSGGKQENMQQAGATIRNAIIGLIIILCSWAIVQFVISSFVGAINGTSGTGTTQSTSPSAAGSPPGS